MKAKTAILTSALCLGMALPAAANRVFVSNEKGNDVTVLDSDTLEVIGTYPVGARPRGITISPDGKELYVCTSDDDLVRVFDPATMKELHTLPSGPDPELFVLHPSGNPLYIANEDDNLVTVVDTKTHKVLAEIPVGSNPRAWASARMARWSSTHLKPPTWRISSTPKPMRSLAMCWWTAARALRNTTIRAPSFTSAPRSAAPSA
jgi:YVTN family beta-propeller protein